MSQAIHGKVCDVKKIRTRGMVAIVVEIPVEHYASAVGAVDEQNVLVTRCDIDLPYGILDSKAEDEQDHGTIEQDYGTRDTAKKGGALCKFAAIMCKDSDFRWFLADKFHRTIATEQDAKQLILDVCNIESRADLDHNDTAKGLFDDLIRKPWIELSERRLSA